MHITSPDALRRLYATPRERAVRKQLAALDPHCRRFIALSPFLVLATVGANGRMDASPRGGAPGFVKCTAQGALLVPDAPGNNRLDSLENIIATGRVGMIFMIPGVDETLRVNGKASVSVREEHIAACTDERRAPKTVIEVEVEEAYLHCAKAFMRSRLWSDDARVQRSVLPTMGQMIGDQTGIAVAPETEEEMRRRYEPDL
jgi:PPOX class probable FMN-dependent enzyme